jgi:hypothetical protein
MSGRGGGREVGREGGRVCMCVCVCERGAYCRKQKLKLRQSTRACPAAIGIQKSGKALVAVRAQSTSQ